MKIIQWINQYLLQIPVYEFYLWITGSRMIKGDCSFESVFFLHVHLILGSPRLSVNYGYSTNITACFNLHFDFVSFITLYRVCNIRPLLFSLPLTKLFFAILRGQPTF